MLISSSILPEKLQSFEYYLNKLPLWLRNDFGFPEHFRIWYDLMMGIRTDLNGKNPDITYYVTADVNEEIVIEDFPFEHSVGEPIKYGSVYSDSLNIQYSPFRMSVSKFSNGALVFSDGISTIAIIMVIGEPPRYMGIVPAIDCWLYLFNIYDKDYLKVINNLQDENEEISDSKADMLDKIAKLFGLRRKVKVSYLNEGTFVKETLNLNNKELLLLIQAQVIKNNWNGTFEELKEFYKNIGLHVHIYTTSAIDPNNPTAHVKSYLVNPTHAPFSDNIIKMFKSGLLRTESMGITYEDDVMNSTDFALWDDNTEEGGIIIRGWGQVSWFI